MINTVFIISYTHRKTNDKLQGEAHQARLHHSYPIPHSSHRRSDDLQRMRLRVEDEPVRAPLTSDLKDAVLIPSNQPALSASFLFGRKKLTGACIKYEYFNTSANKKLSCTLRKDPPFAALTFEMAEKP